MSIWGHLILVAISCVIALLGYRYLKAKGDGAIKATGRMTFSGWFIMILLSYFLLYTAVMLLRKNFG